MRNTVIIISALAATLVLAAAPAHAAFAVVSDLVADGDWIQDIERPPGGYR